MVSVEFTDIALLVGQVHSIQSGHSKITFTSLAG
jgi:hypothetical protein